MRRDLISSGLRTKWIGRELMVFEETDSTNTRGKEAAKKGAGHGLVVIAERQTAGVGRRGRTWVSPDGKNIYVTIMLKPQIQPDKAPMLTILMGLAVCRGIRQLYDVDVKIKWPNDVVIQGRKVCGILTEMSVKSNAPEYIVIGTGINCNQTEFAEEISEKATSVCLETGYTVDREQLVCRVLEAFEQLYETFEKEKSLAFIRMEYEKELVNKDQTVCVMEPGHEWTGKAVGISDTGALLVRNAEGERIAVESGEVSVRGIYGYV